MTTMLKLPPVAVPHPHSFANAPAQVSAAARAQSQPEAMTVNSVRMSSALETRLAEVATRLRMSKSDVIRQALGEFLDKLEPVAPAAELAAVGLTSGELARDFECGPGPVLVQRAG